MKEVTIYPSDIGRVFLYILGGIAGYLFLLHGWVYYILYEWGTHPYKPSDVSSDFITFFRWISSTFFITITVGLLGSLLDGDFDHYKFKIKMPDFAIKDTQKDEIIKLYKQAASYAAEGKQHLADQIYDKINEMTK